MPRHLRVKLQASIGFSDSYVPKLLEDVKYPMVLTEFHRRDYLGSDFGTLEEITPEHAKNVERDTRQQSTSTNLSIGSSQGD